MLKDPTEFRERFLRWKKGELVYENGLALPAYEDGKLSPADAGMIKSKLAIASHFGNPTARRMTNYDGRDYTWPGEYEYNNGIGEPKRGNVYVGSYDNLVTPQIQDNGKTLEFVNDVWDPKNDHRSYMQSLKFNNVRDAIVFGENYKKYAPMMNRYEDGKDANDVTPYTPSIDDREQPGYRKYLWELSKARRNAFLKEYGDAAPIKNYYEDFLSNSEGVFNYRRWYNLASPAERKYGLKKGLAHWADADGKTSLHPSFSIESPYSGYKNPYNPKGITGGKWIDDDHYEFSDSQINNDWPINKTLDEFGQSRKEEGSNTYAYYKGGIVLPEITIIGKKPTKFRMF